MSALLQQANLARQQGRAQEAERLYRAALAEAPRNARVLNDFGLFLLSAGKAEEAVDLLARAVESDPKEAVLRLNLASALDAAGRLEEELAALDAALARDPLMMPALVQKAAVLDRLGRTAEAVTAFRKLIEAAPEASRLPPQTQTILARGRILVAEADAVRAAAVAEPFAAVQTRYPDADFSRAVAYVAQMTGQRRVYVQQPTGPHFPYLPAIEFFDRGLFSWFAELEAATDAIRAELLGVWDEPDGLVPYVAYAPGTPVNQWGELNHSPRWSAFFLWKDGAEVTDNTARCPGTAALLRRLPMLDIPKRGPTAMFSILAPKTRIPAHTGTTNVRTTIHLPLVVPDGCGFRVGGETRAWVEGTAWAFDDTIEHEAWNDSGRPRAILIIDGWNPLLSEAERAMVRETTAALAG